MGIYPWLAIGQPSMRKVADAAGTARGHLLVLARFAVVGGMNTAIDALLFFLLTATTSIAPVIANVISYSAGMLNSYFMNRSWTFRGALGGRHREQFLKFAIFNFLTLGASSAIVWQAAPRWGLVSGKIAAVIATFVLGYFVNRIFVFPDKQKKTFVGSA
jgi:putative flippase GtrA